MSRLQSHRNKEFFARLIGFSILVIVALFFILSVGLKFIIRSSLFINSLFTKNQKTNEVQKNQENTFGSLIIDDLPPATNSASFLITGFSSYFDVLEFYLNEEKVREIEIATSSAFSEKIGPLEKGNNILYVIGKTKNGREKFSPPYTISYIPTKPKLELQEPKDQAKTSKEEIVIRGTTEKGITIRINNIPVVVDANNTFQMTLKLKEGENVIEIVAQDIAQNTEIKTLTIFYQKET